VLSLLILVVLKRSISITFPEYDLSLKQNTISGNRQREHLPADGGRGQQEGRQGQRGLVRSPRNGIHPKRFGRSFVKKNDVFG
jgi:hypothetical protein